MVLSVSDSLVIPRSVYVPAATAATVVAAAAAAAAAATVVAAAAAAATAAPCITILEFPVSRWEDMNINILMRVPSVGVCNIKAVSGPQLLLKSTQTLLRIMSSLPQFPEEFIATLSSSVKSLQNLLASHSIVFVHILSPCTV